jgi:DNA-binding NtrC family response regulator
MGNYKILIVDDEKNIRLTVSQALEVLDLEVDTAVNGEEALEKLASKQYALMLLDLKLPGIHGMELLERISVTNPDVRVIIITAYGTIDWAVQAMKLGAVDFIQKPFSPVEIRKLVDKVLRRESIDSEKARDLESRIELAKRSIVQRNYSAAREHLRQAVAIDPSKPEGLNLLGVISEILGDSTEAMKQYRAAHSLDPTYRPAVENMDRLGSDGQGSQKVSLG